jgi:hypothetical protein
VIVSHYEKNVSEMPFTFTLEEYTAMYFVHTYYNGNGEATVVK